MPRTKSAAAAAEGEEDSRSAPFKSQERARRKAEGESVDAGRGCEALADAATAAPTNL
jgi:hypothetical protein